MTNKRIATTDISKLFTSIHSKVTKYKTPIRKHNNWSCKYNIPDSSEKQRYGRVGLMLQNMSPAHPSAILSRSQGGKQCSECNEQPSSKPDQAQNQPYRGSLRRN